MTVRNFFFGLSMALFATLARGQSAAPITEYAVPYPGSHPQAMALGPDQAIWFTDTGTNSIGHVVSSAPPAGSFTITEFPIPTPNCGPNGITEGSDGAIWFTESNANKIGRITTDGAITEYSLPTPASSPTTITLADDGGVWFTEAGANQIGTILPDGTMREFPIPTPASTPVGIVASGDSRVWFTEYTGNKIGVISTDGTITEIPIPTANSGPLGIGQGSGPLGSGEIWFAEGSANQAGFIQIPPDDSSAIVISEIPLPVPASGVSGSAGGCFTSAINLILCDQGEFAEYPIPTPSSNPQGIAVALPLGSAYTGYWFAESGAGKIGWLNVAPGSQPTSYPFIGGSAALPAATVGVPYSVSLTGGGTPPLTWSALPGTLPAGLTLSNVNSATPTLSGTPSVAGLQTFNIILTDSLGQTVARTFSLQIGAASCTIKLSSSSQSFPAIGGVGTLTVTTPAGCPWSVSQSANWISIQEGPSGVGNGSVQYYVRQNNSSVQQSMVLSINGQSFTIQEAGGTAGVGLQSEFALGTYYSPEMPHLAAGGGWRTSFTLLNTDPTSNEVWTSFYGDDGNLLNLPLTFPEQPSQNTTGAKWVDQTLAPNQSVVFEASGPATSPFTEGLAAVTSGGNVNGFSIFHYDPSGQEAVVPLGGSGFVIPFDNTNGVTTGIALASSNLYPTTFPITVLDDTGAQIGTGSEAVTLDGYGHTSFVLPTQFPVTANKRGMLIVGQCLMYGFHSSNCTLLSTLGIRYTPPGTLTTIPSLGFPAIELPPAGGPPAIEPTGGTMPHIASGSGWQTTFVLANIPAVPYIVNLASGSPKQFTLSFFDDNGNPLTLPLTFPQTGATMTASSVTQTIPANGTLYIQTSGDVGTTLLTGSAQLTGANGFAIFRYNPNGQEAVVPIQQTPSVLTTASVLAFDNTSSIATGVAISNGSAQAVTVPVTIRDDQGNQIGTSTISLAANGHTSFMLATQYSATANIRGTLEFAIPGAGTSSAATIGVLGIRSPPQLTFTTLPALPK